MIARAGLGSPQHLAQTGNVSAHRNPRWLSRATARNRYARFSRSRSVGLTVRRVSTPPAAASGARLKMRRARWPPPSVTVPSTARGCSSRRGPQVLVPTNHAAGAGADDVHALVVVEIGADAA